MPEKKPKASAACLVKPGVFIVGSDDGYLRVYTIHKANFTQTRLLQNIQVYLRNP